MKKMMIIAVLVSGMLMPAQIMAQNNHRNNRKPVAVKYENRKEHKHNDFRVEKKHKHEYGHAGNHRPNNRPHCKPAHHPAPKPVVVHHPAPQPVVVHHPAPKPVVVHHHCNNDVANVAAVALGVAGIISLLAD